MNYKKKYPNAETAIARIQELEKEKAELAGKLNYVDVMMVQIIARADAAVDDAKALTKTAIMLRGGLDGIVNRVKL